jgi:DNA-binding transcriptional ArsR family regulator
MRSLSRDARTVAALKALGNGNRLVVYRRVARAGKALGFGDLRRALGMPKSTLSAALGRLERAGLIAVERHTDRSVAVRASIVGAAGLLGMAEVIGTASMAVSAARAKRTGPGRR